jgi:predicted component of type VI protein secretion system
MDIARRTGSITHRSFTPGGAFMRVSTRLVELIALATGRRAPELVRVLHRLPKRALPRSAEELIDALVGAIDRDLTAQLDAILAHPHLVRLESVWLGLRLLLWRLPQDRALKVELVHCSLDDLAADFRKARDVTRSGLYALVEGGGRDGLGGRPYAAVFCHHAFEASDLPLLERCAAVGELVGVPFVGSAGERLLERSSRTWESFRAKASARFVALVAGRWLARPPHQADPSSTHSWPFHESDRALRFASGTFLLAQRFATSFVAFRTPIHAFGPTMGRVEALPRHEGRSTSGAVTLRDAEAYGARGVIPLVEVGPGLVEFAGSATCLDIDALYPEGELDEDTAQHARLPSVLEAARTTPVPPEVPPRPLRNTRGSSLPSEHAPVVAGRAPRAIGLSRR